MTIHSKSQTESENEEELHPVEDDARNTRVLQDLRASLIENCLDMTEDERRAALRKNMGYDEEYYEGEEDRKTLGKMTDIERSGTLLEREQRIEMESEKIVMIRQGVNQKNATNHSQSLAGTKRKKSSSSLLQETSSFESSPRNSRRKKHAWKSPLPARDEEHEEEDAVQD